VYKTGGGGGVTDTFNNQNALFIVRAELQLAAFMMPLKPAPGKS